MSTGEYPKYYPPPPKPFLCREVTTPLSPTGAATGFAIIAVVAGIVGFVVGALIF